MKNLRRPVSLFLALCTIFALAVPAFAANDYDYFENCGCTTQQNDVISHGVFEDGTEYWSINLTREEFEQRATPSEYNWSDNMNIPVQNIDGTNGRKVGCNFTAYPHEYVVVEVGSLPGVMPTVNLSLRYANGSTPGWIPNANEYSITVFKLVFPSNECYVKISTAEAESRSAKITLYTSEENPKDEYDVSV